MATKVSIIDALTAGGGESTNVDVVEVGTTLVVDDEEDATTDVDVDDDVEDDVDDDVEDDVDEDEDVDADTGVDDDVSGVAATVVDVVDVDVLVVVVVVDVPTCMRPNSAAPTIREADALIANPVQPASMVSLCCHV